MNYLPCLLISFTYIYVNCNGEDASDREWKQYKETSKITFKSANLDNYRRSCYNKNKMTIDLHNAKKHKSFTMRPNKFMHLERAEINMRYNGMYVMANFTPEAWPAKKKKMEELKLKMTPEVDWRRNGLVTSVKHQGDCGSCFAISAVGSIEAVLAQRNGALVEVSSQYYVDCTNGTEWKNHGCKGGLMNHVFRFATYYGYKRETSYPYVAKDGKCRYEEKEVMGCVTNYRSLTKGSEVELIKALENGVVSCAIDSSLSTFHYYSQGIYNDPKCSSTSLNHGVLVVGISCSSGKGCYYIVKNSWGAEWGMGGYFHLPVNANNTCGIATLCSVVTSIGKCNNNNDDNYYNSW